MSSVYEGLGVSYPRDTITTTMTRGRGGLLNGKMAVMMKSTIGHVISLPAIKPFPGYYTCFQLPTMAHTP